MLPSCQPGHTKHATPSRGFHVLRVTPLLEIISRDTFLHGLIGVEENLTSICRVKTKNGELEMRDAHEMGA
jgi:hypothetical protein